MAVISDVSLFLKNYPRTKDVRSSVIEHMFSMCKGLSLIPNNTNTYFC